MICQIAELIVEIPEAGGMAPRCREYLTDSQSTPDIVLCEENYSFASWEGVPYDSACYIESGRLFYGKLLRFQGMMLHASAVAYEGKAYLFSGPSGVGKSTHTHLWQEVFGSAAQIFNDDKPALRCFDGNWFAYGTPWSGKNGINQNVKIPLAGICFLKQGEENSIRPLDAKEAVNLILGQTYHRFRTAEGLDRLLTNVDMLVRSIPIYEMTNRADADCVRMSYETMRGSVEEESL